LGEIERQELTEAARLVAKARRIVVFTGAGVSTESGIPDFRSPGGIWSRYEPEVFTYQYFMDSPRARRNVWQMLKETFFSFQPQPNAAHRAIAELDRRGSLYGIITQNIDGLHQASGIKGEKIFELHGSLRRARCLSCSRHYEIEQIKQRLLCGEEIPECDACGGILKPDIVFFGEILPMNVLEEAFARARSCDLFLVVGSSLVVYPAANIPRYALNAGAGLIIVNMSPTYLDSEADVVIRGRAGEVLNRLVKLAYGDKLS